MAQSPTPALIAFEQIKVMDPMAFIAWGAKNFSQDNNGNTLKFKTSGLCKWKGWVEITYNPGNDLYDIVFGRVRKPRKTKSNPFPVPEWKVDERAEGIYFDNLIEVIDRRVK